MTTDKLLGPDNAQFLRDTRAIAPALQAIPDAFYIDARDLEKLRAIAQRLGDMQTLTHDARRDLMNLLALVIANAQSVRA